MATDDTNGTRSEGSFAELTKSYRQSCERERSLRAELKDEREAHAAAEKGLRDEQAAAEEKQDETERLVQDLELKLNNSVHEVTAANEKAAQAENEYKRAHDAFSPLYEQLTGKPMRHDGFGRAVNHAMEKFNESMDWLYLHITRTKPKLPLNWRGFSRELNFYFNGQRKELVDAKERKKTLIDTIAEQDEKIKQSKDFKLLVREQRRKKAYRFGFAAAALAAAFFSVGKPYLDRLRQPAAPQPIETAFPAPEQPEKSPDEIRGEILSLCSRTEPVAATYLAPDACNGAYGYSQDVLDAIVKKMHEAFGIVQQLQWNKLLVEKKMVPHNSDSNAISCSDQKQGSKTAAQILTVSKDEKQNYHYLDGTCVQYAEQAAWKEIIVPPRKAGVPFDKDILFGYNFFSEPRTLILDGKRVQPFIIKRDAANDDSPIQGPIQPGSRLRYAPNGRKIPFGIKDFTHISEVDADGTVHFFPSAAGKKLDDMFDAECISVSTPSTKKQASKIFARFGEQYYAATNVLKDHDLDYAKKIRGTDIVQFDCTSPFEIYPLSDQYQYIRNLDLLYLQWAALPNHCQEEKPTLVTLISRNNKVQSVKMFSSTSLTPQFWRPETTYAPGACVPFAKILGEDWSLHEKTFPSREGVMHYFNHSFGSMLNEEVRAVYKQGIQNDICKDYPVPEQICVRGTVESGKFQEGVTLSDHVYPTLVTKPVQGSSDSDIQASSELCQPVKERLQTFVRNLDMSTWKNGPYEFHFTVGDTK